MTKITLALIYVFTVSGCIAAWKKIDVPPSFDQSTTDNPAVIRGSRSSANRLDCHIRDPSHTRELVTDSGPLSLQVACYNLREQAGEVTDYAFAQAEFEAEPDHAYEIVGYSLCPRCRIRSKFDIQYIEILEVTNQEHVVIRRPLYDSEVTARESASMAVIVVQAPRNDFQCKLLSSTPTKPGVVMLTPGVATFTVRCLRYNNPFGTRSGYKVEDAYETSLTFDALAGHVYKIDIDEKNPSCIRVFDISRAPRVIGCVPAEQLDEFIGRKMPEEDYSYLVIEAVVTQETAPQPTWVVLANLETSQLIRVRANESIVAIEPGRYRIAHIDLYKVYRPVIVRKQTSPRLELLPGVIYYVGQAQLNPEKGYELTIVPDPSVIKRACERAPEVFSRFALRSVFDPTPDKEIHSACDLPWLSDAASVDN